jgi:hypothetical protein
MGRLLRRGGEGSLWRPACRLRNECQIAIGSYCVWCTRALVKAGTEGATAAIMAVTTVVLITVASPRWSTVPSVLIIIAAVYAGPRRVRSVPRSL